MNKNKGFTLIELLVVIAIIGILSSVVLASLSGARNKAKIAAVQSTLSSMRAQAEIGVENGYYIVNLCAEPGQGGLGNLLGSLNKTASKVTSFKCAVDATTSSAKARKWAVEALIYTKYYCTDSSGYSGLSKAGVTTDGSATAMGGISATTVTISSVVATNYGAAAADLSCID